MPTARPVAELLRQPKIRQRDDRDLHRHFREQRIAEVGAFLAVRVHPLGFVRTHFSNTKSVAANTR